MGGALAVTVRLSDGTEHRMERWTNIIPHWFRTPKVHELGDAHLQAFVDSHEDSDSRFGLMPSEYGLIVVDLQSRTILSSNGYTSLDKFDTSGLSLDLMGGVRYIDATEEDFITIDIAGVPTKLFKQSMIKTFIDFWKAGKILGFELYEESGHVMNGFPDRSDEVLQVELRKLSRKAERGSEDFYGAYLIDWSPLVHETYGNGDSGSEYRKMMARLEQLGFELSDEEKAGWQESIDWIEGNE